MGGKARAGASSGTDAGACGVTMHAACTHVFCTFTLTFPSPFTTFGLPQGCASQISLAVLSHMATAFGIITQAWLSPPSPNVRWTLQQGHGCHD